MIATPLRTTLLLTLILTSGTASAQLRLPDLDTILRNRQSNGGETTGRGPSSQGQGLGGLGGLLGNALPGVGSVGASNAAGILSYCIKNNYLGGANATSILGQLTGKAGTRTAPGYAAGQKGLLQMDSGNMSIAGLKGQATARLCDIVLKRATSFL